MNKETADYIKQQMIKDINQVNKEYGSNSNIINPKEAKETYQFIKRKYRM